jgi:ABC-type transport system involved in multi-copper enzyme maturation permease subunit
MRLALAELLGMRKRLATYVVLIVLLVLMTLVYLSVGALAASEPDLTAAFFRFPAAYGTISQFVFGLGSLLAVAYAAAIAGGDWTWGVPRLLISRGASRVGYVLSKAVALAGVLAIGALIAFAVGMLLHFISAALAGVSTGSPVEGDGVRELVEALLFGYPVLLERALIGFAVAIVLRSQLAGVVVGILLYIGEGILVQVLLVITLLSRGMAGVVNMQPIGPEWYQYLPFTIGDSLLAAGQTAVGGGLEDLLLRHPPVEHALLGMLVYSIVALGGAALVVRRMEITG